MHDTPRVIYTVIQVMTLLDTNKQQTMTGVQPWLQQAPKTEIKSNINFANCYY